MEAMFSRIVGAITVSFNTCIDRVMGQMEQKLIQRLDMHGKETFDLSLRVDGTEARNRALTTENDELKLEIKKLNQLITKTTSVCDVFDQY